MGEFDASARFGAGDAEGVGAADGGEGVGFGGKRGEGAVVMAVT
ncbi:hypothetical protein [Corynebacterium deserti]|nr:hypothetical protein [Corynebacterium deserti]